MERINQVTKNTGEIKEMLSKKNAELFKIIKEIKTYFPNVLGSVHILNTKLRVKTTDALDFTYKVDDMIEVTDPALTQMREWYKDLNKQAENFGNHLNDVFFKIYKELTTIFKNLEINNHEFANRLKDFDFNIVFLAHSNLVEAVDRLASIFDELQNLTDTSTKELQDIEKKISGEMLYKASKLVRDKMRDKNNKLDGEIDKLREVSIYNGQNLIDKFEKFNELSKELEFDTNVARFFFNFSL